ncbi:MAG: hypothetical protein V1851_02630 [Patescibacteria group bacterium]
MINMIDVISMEIGKSMSIGLLPLDLRIGINKNSIVVDHSTTITLEDNGPVVNTTDDTSPESDSIGSKIIQIISEIKGLA